MRRLDLRVLGLLVALAAVIGTGMHVVHGIQIQRNASALLDRACRAQAGNDLAVAEQLLSQYLNLSRGWPCMGKVRSGCGSAELGSPAAERVFLVYEEALRHNPGEPKLERRCADIALEQERFSDAQRHLTNLLDTAPARFAGPTGGRRAGRAGGSAGSM